MRLWHIDLIPYLPKSQLLAQWRELNSIFKKQDKHILINYIYDYSDHYLFDYTCAVLNELGKRNIKTNTSNCYCYFYLFGDYGTIKIKNKYDYKFKEHNDEYLTICYWNLREKYLRGQKDFTKEIWEKLDNFYYNIMTEETLLDIYNKNIKEKE